MQKIIIYLLTLILSVSNLFSAEWINNTYSTMNIKDRVFLPDGSIYSNFDVSGQGTSNLEKYSVTKCSGNRIDKDGKLLEITTICEVELTDGNKYWTKLERKGSASDAGVGTLTILGGTNEFSKLKNIKCNYAVSYFKNKIFNSRKCKVNNNLFKILKK